VLIVISDSGHEKAVQGELCDLSNGSHVHRANQVEIDDLLVADYVGHEDGAVERWPWRHAVGGHIELNEIRQ